MFVLGSGKSDARTRKSMPWASFRAFYDWQQQLVVHTFRGRGKFPLFFRKMWEQNRETRRGHKWLAVALFHLRVLLPWLCERAPPTLMHDLIRNGTKRIKTHFLSPNSCIFCYFAPRWKGGERKKAEMIRICTFLDSSLSITRTKKVKTRNQRVLSTPEATRRKKLPPFTHTQFWRKSLRTRRNHLVPNVSYCPFLFSQTWVT